MLRENPCLSCGACCAHFRVSFYWTEAESTYNGAVPLALTEDLPPHRRCMHGTNQAHPRCVALEGMIGQMVQCSIYAERSSTCREFGVDWDGQQLVYTPEDMIRCTQARAAWGLPPLLGPAPDRYPEAPIVPDRIA